ncbi:hypothetical protein [Plantactinospora sonchi]|uniref:Uncharacterized protein n=1 Tax=Plantactinospora sonchi TaxID=1544735 RepID=A0ABU7RUW9_9ACTN
MRFNKVHPAFVALLVVSFIGLAVSFLLMVNASGACIADNGTHTVDAACVRKAENEESAGLMITLASLTIMLGGVGFQVGRTNTQPMGLPLPVPSMAGAAPANPGQPQPYAPFQQPAGYPTPGGPTLPGQPGPGGNPNPHHPPRF